MTTGQKIINDIIASGLMHAECPAAPGETCIVKWSISAADQIDARIAEYTAKQRGALQLADATLAELGACETTAYRRVIADALLP